MLQMYTCMHDLFKFHFGGILIIIINNNINAGRDRPYVAYFETF